MSTIIAGLLVFIALHGCGSAEAPLSGHDLVQTEESVSTVETLVLLVSVRLVEPTNPDFEAYDGFYVDFRQIEALGLAVDEEPWGLFAADEVTDAETPEVDVNGWWLSESASQAVIVATLGLETGSAPHELNTVADWVALLNRRLAAGGHVAEIDQIQIKNANGDGFSLQARILQPFEISQGDATSFVGEIIIEIATLGDSS